jgi:hypothetical protein
VPPSVALSHLPGYTDKTLDDKGGKSVIRLLGDAFNTNVERETPRKGMERGVLAHPWGRREGRAEEFYSIALEMEPCVPHIETYRQLPPPFASCRATSAFGRLARVRRRASCVLCSGASLFRRFASTFRSRSRLLGERP